MRCKVSVHGVIAVHWAGDTGRIPWARIPCAAVGGIRLHAAWQGEGACCFIPSGKTPSFLYIHLSMLQFFCLILYQKRSVFICRLQ